MLENVRRATPEKVLLGFAALAALAAVAAVRDGRLRADLEWSVLPTALGDGSYCGDPPAPVPLKVPGVEGEWISAGRPPEARVNEKMQRLGHDEALGLTFYRAAGETGPVKSVWIKAAEGRFVELAPAPAKP